MYYFDSTAISKFENNNLNYYTFQSSTRPIRSISSLCHEFTKIKKFLNMVFSSEMFDYRAFQQLFWLKASFKINYNTRLKYLINLQNYNVYNNLYTCIV